jgi:hypothetical protein
MDLRRQRPVSLIWYGDKSQFGSIRADRDAVRAAPAETHMAATLRRQADLVDAAAPGPFLQSGGRADAATLHPSKRRAWTSHSLIALVEFRILDGCVAPVGCSHESGTIDWDQPQLVAACAITGLTGDPRFKRAVDDYVTSFLAHGIDENGLFEWGNHRYYNAYTDKVVRFGGGPHEIRPLTPAWGFAP